MNKSMASTRIIQKVFTVHYKCDNVYKKGKLYHTWYISVIIIIHIIHFSVAHNYNKL